MRANNQNDQPERQEDRQHDPGHDLHSGSTLIYYLQQTLGYSPLVTGIAFLPISAGSAVTSNLSTIVLMPRLGPKPLVGFGMLAAPSAMVWLAQQFPHH